MDALCIARAETPSAHGMKHVPGAVPGRRSVRVRHVQLRGPVSMESERRGQAAVILPGLAGQIADRA